MRFSTHKPFFYSRNAEIEDLATIVNHTHRLSRILTNIESQPTLHMPFALKHIACSYAIVAKTTNRLAQFKAPFDVHLREYLTMLDKVESTFKIADPSYSPSVLKQAVEESYRA